MHILWSLRSQSLLFSCFLILLFTTVFVTKAIAAHHVLDIPLEISAHTSTANYAYRGQIHALRRALTVPLLDPALPACRRDLFGRLYNNYV